ncbi:uncharacterized protein LOC120781688 [Bactrocera tryoni]|uniref:uncharacterized protein LOC120781688 n=1 Tax=Bactrocera tryoni TaxID=59916 RepID=UPI001A96D461|nr:uncharacterized protein LOC120781688 [Bactrocera tryoni]
MISLLGRKGHVQNLLTKARKMWTSSHDNPWTTLSVDRYVHPNNTVLNWSRAKLPLKITTWMTTLGEYLAINKTICTYRNTIANHTEIIHKTAQQCVLSQKHPRSRARATTLL